MKNKNNWNRWDSENFDNSSDTSLQFNNKKKSNRKDRIYIINARVIFDHQDFKCLQCKSFVTASREQSGVNNRNHCPLCLWSRHMDLYTPGDRKSDCRSRMRPIGLTIKRTAKRYAERGDGELMLIHECIGCGKYSLNRLAADDDALGLFNIYVDSWNSDVKIQNHLWDRGIFRLGENDLCQVQVQLFGRVKRWN